MAAHRAPSSCWAGKSGEEERAGVSAGARAKEMPARTQAVMEVVRGVDLECILKVESGEEGKEKGKHVFHSHLPMAM